MELFFCGLAGTYEAEHIARMFFPGAKLVQRRCAPGAPCVRVRRAGARVLCGVRTAQRCGVKAFRLPDGAGPKEEEYEVCRALYMLLRAETGVRPPWGMLTGVRPVRLLHDMRRRGLSPAQQQAFFCRRNDVSAEKYKLAVEIANNQQDVIKRSTLRSYSLYISIPFCPSRCSYCSFVSTTTEKSGALVAPYLQRLEQELQSIAAMAEKLRLRLETVYIGGGTPTAVSAQQLARLMAAVRGAFDFSHVREFTVEAGRPDCTTPKSWPSSAREGPRASPSTRRRFQTRCCAPLGAAIRRRTCWTASPPRAKPGTAISIWTSLPAFRWIRPPALKKALPVCWPSRRRISPCTRLP